MSPLNEEMRQGSGLEARGADTFPASQSGPGDRGRDGWWRTLEERAEDPAFQEQMKPKGKSFRLTEGQTSTLDLKLVQ